MRHALVTVSFAVSLATLTGCGPMEDAEADVVIDAAPSTADEASSEHALAGWKPSNVTAPACIQRSVSPAALWRAMSVTVTNRCGYDAVISVGYKAGLNPREQNTTCYFLKKNSQVKVTPVPTLINGTQNVRYDRVQGCTRG